MFPPSPFTYYFNFSIDSIKNIFYSTDNPVTNETPREEYENETVEISVDRNFLEQDCDNTYYMDPATTTLSQQNNISNLEEVEERARLLHNLSSISYQESFEELSTILYEIQQWNQLEATTRSLDYYIKDIIEKISNQATPHELLQLTSLINKNFSEQSIYWIAAIFSAARHKIPTLKRYVTSKIITYSQILPVITAECASRIVKEKLEKKQLHELFFPPVFCKYEIARKVAEFVESNKSLGILLTNTDIGLNGHFSPFIVERVDDSIRILSSDSLFTHDDDIEDIIVDLQSLSIDYEIYFFTEKRQRDSFSCPIFSIQDLSEALNITTTTKKSFFEYLKEHSQIEQGFTYGKYVNRITRPPSAMNKLIQSMKKLKEMDDEVILKRGKEIFLKDYIQKHTYMTKDIDIEHKAINLAAAKKSGKFFEKALQFAIDSLDTE